MSELNSLLSSLPINDLAQRVGASPHETERALNDLLPSLVGGMQANAQRESGAASLSSALEQHRGGARSVDEVDTDDGAKIAHHVFGGEQDAVVAKVADNSGTDKGLIQKLLPIVAPLVMAWLASRFTQKKNESTQNAEQAQNAEPAETGSGLGDLLGSILGGGSSGDAGGGLGNILGQLGGLLGGGR